MAKVTSQRTADGAALNFEAQLWAAADKMRGHMDASEYKHVCLGLIFLKYISDAFDEKREQLLFGLPRNRYSPPSLTVPSKENYEGSENILSKMPVGSTALRPLDM